jgi:transposase
MDSTQYLHFKLLKIRINKAGFVIGKFNPLSPELNPVCYLLALLGAYSFLRVSRIRVKSLTLRLLMSYIYIYIYIYIWSTYS